MGFSKLTTDLNNHQNLSDEPNINDGYTAEQLKELYDKAPNDIKTYINSLVDAINSKTSASNLGAKKLQDGETASNVQAEIEYLQEQLQEVVLGQIPDGTITETKLATALSSLLAKKNGILQTNLNAEMLSGKTIEEIDELGSLKLEAGNYSNPKYLKCDGSLLGSLDYPELVEERPNFVTKYYFESSAIGQSAYKVLKTKAGKILIATQNSSTPLSYDVYISNSINETATLLETDADDILNAKNGNTIIVKDGLIKYSTDGINFQNSTGATLNADHTYNKKSVITHYVASHGLIIIGGYTTYSSDTAAVKLLISQDNGVSFIDTNITTECTGFKELSNGNVLAYDNLHYDGGGKLIKSNGTAISPTLPEGCFLYKADKNSIAEFDGKVYWGNIATSVSYGVLYSTDYGETWLATSGLNASSPGYGEIRKINGNIYVNAVAAHGYQYVSTDGITFSKVVPEIETADNSNSYYKYYDCGEYYVEWCTATNPKLYRINKNTGEVRVMNIPFASYLLKDVIKLLDNNYLFITGGGIYYSTNLLEIIKTSENSNESRNYSFKFQDDEGTIYVTKGYTLQYSNQDFILLPNIDNLSTNDTNTYAYMKVKEE